MPSRAESGTKPQPEQRFNALVLAGRRDSNDALAKAANAPHRALLDIAGVPMLARVLETLLESKRFEQIFLSFDVPILLDQIPEIARMLNSGEVKLVPVADSPSRSVLAGLDAIESDDALLITAGDHALLDDEMLGHFLGAIESGTDVAVGLVSSATILARFPEAQRTYLPFRGERYSGANLFAFLTPRARRAAEFWRRAEQHRKTPWRLVGSFGLVTLALFVARRLDLAAAFERVSKVIGVEARAVEMPMAEAAVDVDKISDLELVNQIFAEREVSPSH